MSKGTRQQQNYYPAQQPSQYSIPSNGPSIQVYQGYQNNPSIVIGQQVITPQLHLSKRSIVEAYILAIALGFTGAHHFYLRRCGFGLVYLFTFGLLGCGWIIDCFRLPSLVARANQGQGNKKKLDDAYVLWLPFGIFGFHHFYLRNYGLGFLYLFTFGLFGVGWIVDLFMMPKHVKEANSGRPNTGDKSICTAYIFTLSPAGLLGVHHFYLNRPFFGVVYLCTFGLLGVGWVVDWFRVPLLVRKFNENRKSTTMPSKRLDDVYLMWFPLGFLGLHHFYLGRLGWGFLYLFTFGALGIGWIIDGFRLPGLLNSFNEERDARRRMPVFTDPVTATIGTGPAGPYVGASVGGSAIVLNFGNDQHSNRVPEQPNAPPAYTNNTGYQSNPLYATNHPGYNQQYATAPTENPPPYSESPMAGQLPSKRS